MYFRKKTSKYLIYSNIVVIAELLFSQMLNQTSMMKFSDAHIPVVAAGCLGHLADPRVNGR